MFVRRQTLKRSWRFIALVACLVLVSAHQTGCRRMSGGGWEPAADVAVDALPNPLPVPMVSREMVMDEVSDEIDDYFRILREQRLRLVDNILTEGWIDTEPRIGATVLEPWRRDSTPGFELKHASLQSVRRWAKVRIIPGDGRYLIDLMVFKELGGSRRTGTLDGQWKSLSPRFSARFWFAVRAKLHSAQSRLDSHGPRFYIGA